MSLTSILTHGAWLKSDLNQARLDNFYWMLAVFGAFNFMIFLVLSSRHQYKTQHDGASSNSGEQEIEAQDIGKDATSVKGKEEA